MTANAGSIGPSNDDDHVHTLHDDLDSNDNISIDAVDASNVHHLPTSVSLGSEDKKMLDKQLSSIDVLDATKAESVQQPQVEPINASNNSISSKTTAKPPPPSSGQKAPASTNNNGNKNPFEVFNEYVAFFFRKAEDYEETLERRESKVDLRASMQKVESMDKVRHGASTLRYNGSRIELAVDENDSRKEDIDVGKVENGVNEQHEPSPRLSPKSEAIVAVEAISSFRPLTEIREEYKQSRSHSVGTDIDEHSVKKQKSSSTQQAEMAVEEWEEFCATKKQNPFSDVAIENTSLSLTVQEFHDLVLKDNAVHSIGKFMTDIGDMDVEATAWEPKGGQPIITRTIHYIHPVNAPMAPPTAKAFKTQYLHKFGDIGLCLESSTIVEDVPMTDCFVVDDLLWVSQDEETGGCIVNVTFQIRFVKTTMFRRIIENATRSEFQKWWTQFGEMVSALQGAAAVQAREEEDLEMVATELEEVTILLEGECDDVELTRDALNKIRSTSKRLSMVAKRASVRRTKDTPKQRSRFAEIVSCAHEILIASIGKSVSCLKDIGKSENAGGAFVLLLGLGVMNLWTYRQLMVTNQLLSDMSAQLKHLSVANEVLLSKLGQPATCSS